MSKVKTFYDNEVSDNLEIHQHIFDKVFGIDEYIGQYSDNSASEIHDFAKIFNIESNANVLDIGCGNGCIANFLSQGMDWNITGIDISEKSIEKAIDNNKQIFKNTSLKFVCQDFFQFQPKEMFHAVYGIGAFCHFEPVDLFSQINKIIINKGKLGFMERIKLDSPLSKEEYRKLTTEWHCPGIYSVEEYKELLSPNFENIHFVDLTDSAKIWHERSVSVREKLKPFIISQTSETYYTKSLNLAKYEAEPCLAGKIGYGSFIATKKS